MAVAHTEIIARLSGGGGNGDPTLSLGGALSSIGLHNAAGTFTSNASVGDTVVFDSAEGGSDDDRNGEYMLFIENGTLEVARITDYRASDGRFLLDRPLLNAVTSGDAWRSFAVNDTFDALTPAQCSLGHTDYRGFYWLNNASTRLVNFSMFLIPIDRAGVSFDIACRDDDTVMQTIANDTIAPDLGSGPFGTTEGKFSSPRSRILTGGIFEQPTQDSPLPSLQILLSQGDKLGYWMRRTIPPNTRRRDHVAWLVVGEGTDDEGAPVDRRMAAVIAFDVQGFTPDLTLTSDRSARYGGGVRYTVTVKALETGAVVPDLPVGWAITAGPGVLTTDVSPVTDVNGQNSAAYAAPKTEAPIVDSFLNAGSLPTGYTLVRASDGYDGSFVDLTGSMLDAAANVARWTYDPVTLALRGMLNEPTRTNLQLDSEVPKDATADWGNTNGILTPAFSGLPLLGVDVTRIESTGHSGGASLGGIAVSPVLSGSTAGRTFATSVYIQDNGSVGTQIILRIREIGGVSGPGTMVDITHTLPANVARFGAQGDVVEDDRTSLTGFMGRAASTDDYDFVQGFVEFEEIPVGEEKETSSWIRTTTTALARGRDTLIRTGLPNGVYDVTIAREGIADVLVSGVLITSSYEVPTSVHPLQTVTFTPVTTGLSVTVEAQV